MDRGRREYVRRLLGAAFALEFFDDESLLLGDSPETMWDLFVAGFGPIKALPESLGDERRRALHDAFVEYPGRIPARRRNRLGPREYVVIVGRRQA